MTLDDLKTFSLVAASGVFEGRAQIALHAAGRPPGGAAARRQAGERLIDRSSRVAPGRRDCCSITPTGCCACLTKRRAVSDLRDVARDGVLIGANEGAIHSILPH
jgi:hypothetical protein